MRIGKGEQFPEVDESKPIPAGATCMEVAMSFGDVLILCSKPAKVTVRHENDGRSYYMCPFCAWHNIHKRGGVDVTVKKAVKKTGKYKR